MARAQSVTLPSRIARVAAAVVEAGWLAAVIVVPLAVNPWGSNYELPRVGLFRGLVLVMLAAHFVALAWWSEPPRPRGWVRRPLVRPILLVAAILALSTLTSLSPLVSLWGSYHRQQGAYLLLCFVLWALLVVTHLRTPAQRGRLTAAITVAGTLVALTPFVQSLHQHENPLSERPAGSLGNPIFLGAYLIMAIPFTLTSLISDCGSRIAEPPRHSPRAGVRRSLSGPLRIAGWGVTLVLQLFALLISQSRGPWVGGLVGLTLFAALMLWHTRWRRLMLVGVTAGVILVGGLLAGLNIGLAPSSRLSQMPYVERVAAAANVSGRTVRVRLVLWEAAVGAVTSWPEIGLEPDRLHVLRPLVGYGPDTAAIVYTATYPPELAHIEDPDAIWDRAHNEVLDLLAMQGWLGLAGWVVLAVACARRGLTLWRTAQSPAERAWVAAPLAALAAHAVEVQFAFSVTATSMMTWMCVALLAAPSLAKSPRAMGGTKGRRWRVYAVTGALGLMLVAVWLEGGALWADVLVARARVLDDTGQWQESIELYDRALALVPWQATYHQFRAKVFYNLARVLPTEKAALKTDLLGAADRSLARARALEPLEIGYYSNAGVLHAYWSEAVDPAHLGTAAAFYEQALRLGPTQTDLRTDLGHIYHNHALYAEALAQYRAALEIDPLNATAYYDSALAWLALEEADRARLAFEAALELAPGCRACWEALQGLEE